MNVYFTGSEDIELAYSGVNIVGSGYRPGWARQGINCPGAGQITTATFTPRTVVWAHGQCAIQDQRTTNLFYLIALFTTAGGQGVIGACGTGASGQIKIVKRSNAGVVTTLATSATGAQPGLGTSTAMSVDFFVNYSTTGQAALWINGALVIDTGSGVDTTTDGATGGVNQLYLSTAGPNNTTWSEIIVADSDTRAAGLWMMNSSTAGNSQTWTGTPSNVNEGQINDGTMISAASAGLIEQFKTAAVPAGTYTVAGVKIIARALIGTAGPQNLEYVTRVGSTDYVGGSWSPSVGAFINDAQNYLIAVNPATGLAWTTADLTASTFNYGIESVA